ncbi:adenylate/guanylate cyclase domain-containing protein [Magnetovibrio sp.]|uniref:adenylate/guanylate cyclase domain-containing protein n=1 Tax=Magnetovibrio sp. TaxID=2024836 RepID=UPI002F92D864
MAQKDDVTYELLLFTAGRWETQGVYAANEHHTAVADAKSLAKVSTVKGVKVVKESFDQKAGASRSFTVYEYKPQESAPAKASAPKKSPAPAKEKKASKASQTGDVREDHGQKAESPKKGGSLLGAFIKILVSLLFSLAAAMVVTQLVSLALQGVHSVGLFGKADFLNLVFILVFVIMALALITRILVTMKNIAPILKTRPAPTAKPAKRTRLQRLTPSVDSFREERLESEAQSLATQEEERKKAEEEARLAEEEARRKAEAEAAKKAEADALSELVTMNAFAEDAFDVLQDDKSKQDAHTVFGLVLFLVGAVQALRHQHKLSETVSNSVMAQTLSGLGLSKERAEHFSQHIDEYLISNPRYSEMFQNGRSAMGEYLKSDTGPRGALSDALVAWDKPKSKSEGSTQPVTVLFTDIAGSTAMTQKLGDEGAQAVVRSHNSIVREAIQGFSGKEIKHTGDGIMASFPSAAAGVEAAMEMQKRTRSHNESDPNHPLGLKIGLNAGEPISEDDDLFGTTVQLAARIVDKASAGQILVSSSVHGLSQGKSLKFERFADLDMKGFDDPVTVYSVVWNPDDAPATPPKAEASKAEGKDAVKNGEKPSQKAENAPQDMMSKNANTK